MTNFAYSSALNNLVGNTPGANVSNLVQCLNDLKTFLNSPNLDGTNIADIPESLLALAVQQKLGLNDGSQIGRGKSIIPATESRTNTAYGTMATPDQVSNVVLPADGLLFIAFQGVWQESVDGAARAAFFVGANQAKIAQSNTAAPVGQETAHYLGANLDGPLASCGGGIISTNNQSNVTAYTGDVTTGQIIGDAQLNSGGGSFCMRAAAGTYTVSLQTKSTSGSVTLKNRNLYVWTMAF